MNGPETIRQPTSERPELPIALLSSLIDPEGRQEALPAGAAAFVPKSPGMALPAVLQRRRTTASVYFVVTLKPWACP
jgi:DNA-binding NarL/FixJ family response regulator